MFQLQKSKKVKVEQLSCSNLRHLGAMVECARRNGVIAVCKIFHINESNKLVIDVISDQGKTWTKGMIKCVVIYTPRRLMCHMIEIGHEHL